MDLTFAEKQWLQAARNLIGFGSVLERVVAGFVAGNGVEVPLFAKAVDVEDVEGVEDAIDVVVVALAPVNPDVSDRECDIHTQTRPPC
jgi:hypothetical protein